MPSLSPPSPGRGAPAGKKPLGPVLVLMLAFGGVVAVIGLAVLAGGLFLRHKAKQAGVDTDLVRSNPGLAAAKMLAAANPDLELIDMDETAKTVTLRQKSSGKTVTLDVEELRQGRISFETGEGERGTISAGGDRMRIEQGGASIEWEAGGEARLPAWLPVYAGAEVKGSTTTRTAQGETHSVILLTPDSVDRVSAWYQAVLVRAGLTVELVSQKGESRADVISASSADEKRQASVVVGREAEGTIVTLTARESP